MDIKPFLGQSPSCVSILANESARELLAALAEDVARSEEPERRASLDNPDTDARVFQVAMSAGVPFSDVAVIVRKIAIAAVEGDA
jgi:hypothetical protein